MATPKGSAKCGAEMMTPWAAKMPNLENDLNATENDSFLG